MQSQKTDHVLGEAQSPIAVVESSSTTEPGVEEPPPKEKGGIASSQLQENSSNSIPDPTSADITKLPKPQTGKVQGVETSDHPLQATDNKSSEHTLPMKQQNNGFHIGKY